MARLPALGVEVSTDVLALRGGALRRAATACAVLAVGRAGMDDPRVLRALEGAASGPADEQTLAALSALVDELDEQAWDLQDLVDAGEADDADHDRVWRRARAAAALRYALDPDSTTHAAEAVYEAHHAMLDLPALDAALLRAAAGPDEA